MDITKDIRYLGVNDHKIDLVESQYIVPDGMSYNSYLIDGGDKTIVMDTVDGLSVFQVHMYHNFLLHHKLPFVESTSLIRSSKKTAISNAFTNTLNIASII